MTTEAAPANQDHLRHAPHRQRGAPRRFEAGVEEARAGLGGHHRNFIDGRWVRRRRRRSRSARRSTASSLVGTFAKGDRAGRRATPIAAARRGPAGLGRDALAASAWRSCAAPPSSSPSAR